MFAALGVEVHLIDPRAGAPAVPRPRDGRGASRAAMTALGVRLHLERQLDHVSRDGRRSRGGADRPGAEIEADKRPVRRRPHRATRTGSASRTSASRSTARIRRRGRGLPDRVPSIYAAGDVIGFPALACTSMEQARVAVCHAFGFTYKRQVAELFPYGVYTIPEVSLVGLAEDDADAARDRRRRGPRAVRGQRARADHRRPRRDREARVRPVDAQADRRATCIGERAIGARPRRPGRHHPRRHASRPSSRWSSTTRRSPRATSTPRTTRSRSSAQPTRRSRRGSVHLRPGARPPGTRWCRARRAAAPGSPVGIHRPHVGRGRSLVALGEDDLEAVRREIGPDSETVRVAVSRCLFVPSAFTNQMSGRGCLHWAPKTTLVPSGDHEGRSTIDRLPHLLDGRHRRDDLPVAPIGVHRRDQPITVVVEDPPGRHDAADRRPSPRSSTHSRSS